MSQNGTKIYVGNLSYNVTDEQLKDYFEQFGTISELNLITDRETGRSKGFAFVCYESASNAEKAIEVANGTELGGRAMNVNLARDKNSTSAPRRDYNNRGGARPGGRPAGRFSDHKSRDR